MHFPVGMDTDELRELFESQLQQHIESAGDKHD